MSSEEELIRAVGKLIIMTRFKSVLFSVSPVICWLHKAKTPCSLIAREMEPGILKLEKTWEPELWQSKMIQDSYNPHFSSLPVTSQSHKYYIHYFMTAVVLRTVADLRSANDLVFVSLFFFLLFKFFLSKERVVYRGLKCFIDKKKNCASTNLSSPCSSSAYFFLLFSSLMTPFPPHQSFL